MILITHDAHESYYLHARKRWHTLLRVIAMIVAVAISIIIPIAIHQNYALMKAISVLHQEMEHNQTQIQEIVDWKSAVEAHEASLTQRQANQALADTLYERLSDFKHVNLRLLRIRSHYLYCIIGGVSESALTQYQRFMRKIKYRSIQKQEIDKLWFLEFSSDEHKKSD